MAIKKYGSLQSRKGSYGTNNTQTKVSGFANVTDEESAIDTVKGFFESSEANIVSAIYGKPDLYFGCRLKSEDFYVNSWRVYYLIAEDIINSGKTLTEDNINFYLDQHLKLKSVYDQSGGYAAVEKCVTVADISGFDSFVNEHLKWQAVVKVHKAGFPIKDRLSEFADMNADQIYDEYTALLNDAFINTEQDIKIYNGFEGLNELNAECSQGLRRGLDFYGVYPKSAQILNAEVNGFDINGQIYGLGAVSGMGKSSLAINLLFPTALATREKILFIINEEDQNKFKKEAETWVINNLLIPNNNIKLDEANLPYEQIEYIKQCREEYSKYYPGINSNFVFNKRKFIRGGFTPEEMVLLSHAAHLLQMNKEDRLITIVPLEKYSVTTAIKLIRKYSSLFGIRMFVLDTLKESCDSRNVDTWKAMERDLVELYNVIKPSVLNVGLFVTYQLGKQSIKTRYLTNAEIGQARNIVDVMSVNLMIRRPFSDEIDGGRNAICYRPYGVRMPSKNQDDGPEVDLTLTDKENSLIVFVCKNRNGVSSQHQIISYCNFGTNVYQELGTAYIKEDF